MAITNKHLLYLEDNPMLYPSNIQLFSLFFEHTVHAKNGAEGLEAYLTHSFDLILTDINMPVMDGVEFIKRIRKIDTKIPIYVYTSTSKSTLDIDNLQITQYFEKPIGLSDFLELWSQPKV